MADLETDRDHGATALGSRVGMPHARDFQHQPLQRLGNQAGYLVCRGAGILHEHVDHRHRDLRVFLARGEEQADEADQQRHDQYHRGNRRHDKQACRPACDTE